jgi:predicted GNAT family N-acyltransferase
MSDFRCVWAAHGSELYAQCVDLRRKILRTPLGLDFSFEELDAEAGEHHLACFSGSNLVGCLSMRQVENGFKMRQVAVSSEAQGIGVGKAMVRFVEAWARLDGAAEINLHARITAVPFYLALDYLAVGAEFQEVGIPHVAMRKFL